MTDKIDGGHPVGSLHSLMIDSNFLVIHIIFLPRNAILFDQMDGERVTKYNDHPLLEKGESKELALTLIEP
jgi:hypothetical protein